MSRKLIILGISGNIGTQALEVINENKNLILVGFSLGHQVDKINEILTKHKEVKYICVQEKKDFEIFQKKYPNIKFFYGDNGLIELIENCEADLLLNALVGFVGLEPTLKAIEKNIDVALANKETLVVGGELVKKALKHSKSQLIPVDSEHSAIYKCFKLTTSKNVKKIILTASGGAFRNLSRDELKNVTVKEALHHPTWKMGKKVTIDSASMLNKGFEIIEAYYLFDFKIEDISILMHDESNVHSLLLLNNGKYIGEVNKPSMINPIRYALNEDKNINPNEVKMVDKLSDFGNFHFHDFDIKRYPMVQYALQAIEMGGIMPTVLNATDEVAVDLFLKGMISFLDIEKIIELALKTFTNIKHPSLEMIKTKDKEVREWAKTASLLNGSL